MRRFKSSALALGGFSHASRFATSSRAASAMASTSGESFGSWPRRPTGGTSTASGAHSQPEPAGRTVDHHESSNATAANCNSPARPLSPTLAASGQRRTASRSPVRKKRNKRNKGASPRHSGQLQLAGAASGAHSQPAPARRTVDHHEASNATATNWWHQRGLWSAQPASASPAHGRSSQGQPRHSGQLPGRIWPEAHSFTLSGTKETK